MHWSSSRRKWIPFSPTFHALFKCLMNECTFRNPLENFFFLFFIFFSVCVQWCRNSNPKKSLTFREPSVCRRDLANVSSLNPSLCRVPQSPVAKFYDSLREYKEKKSFTFFFIFSLTSFCLTVIENIRFCPKIKFSGKY